MKNRFKAWVGPDSKSSIQISSWYLNSTTKQFAVSSAQKSFELKSITNVHLFTCLASGQIRDNVE